jgi:hypothetical protein
MRIDTVEFFDRLADFMNTDSSRYELLGDLDLEMAVVMRRGDGDAFRVLLGFEGIECETVAAIDDGAETAAECWLEGDLSEGRAMFTDIARHGQATGEWTLNTLTMMGDRIQLKASDPMGWDKFHRFNQTLQDFVDASTPLLDASISTQTDPTQSRTIQEVADVSA